MDESGIYARKDKSTGKCQLLEKHAKKVSKICGDKCSKIGLRNIGELVGLVHDMGKASEQWQEYLKNDSYEKADHSTAGAYWVYNQAIDERLKRIISIVICGHHGGLMDSYQLDNTDNLEKRITSYDKNLYFDALKTYLNKIADEASLKSLLALAENEFKLIYKKIISIPAVSTDKKESTKDTLFTFSLTARFILSCLVDADRWDSFTSMLDNPQNAPKPYKADWKLLSSRLEKRIEELGKKCANDIDKARQEISYSCFKNAGLNCGIYRLSAPTGSGKTYASMRFALNHVHDGGRIFYVAPFKTILEQTATDIKSVLHSRCILEHHSDITERNEKYDIFAERWNMPIILTTMVQFLDTLFCGSNTCTRRFHNLAGSVIIIDEVQALPIECTWIFNLTLRFLCNICGSTILLVTATQPAIELEKMKNHAVRFSQPKDIAPDLRRTFENSRRINVIDKTNIILTSETLAKLVLDCYNKDKTVLCIVNTKTAAGKLYDHLKTEASDAVIYYLTTNMCAQHRLHVLKKIKRRLKKKLPAICISTQLIEAGVDISFHTVVRSLAGLDSIAQAAGRCNRSMEYDDGGTVVIVKYGDERLEHLPTIKKAQIATETTLADFQRNCKQFNESLFSEETISRYYQHLYGENENILGFPAQSYNNSNLFEMLSYNEKLSFKGGFWRQAFRSAGEIFHVIEPGGVTVIVPYGLGKELMRNIIDAKSFEERRKYLRRAQRYSVTLRKWEWDQLYKSGMIESMEEMGVHFLSEFAYDSEGTGVKIKQTGGLEIIL